MAGPETGININNITFYNDNLSDIDIIKNIIDKNNQEDAFYIVDIEDIIKQHKKWVSMIPRVIPHYAIKCNPNETVIRVIAALNGKFDCASKQEIRQVLEVGVKNDDIIFANPAKLPSHIQYAKKVGVSTMTIDNPLEVLKIKELYPDAKLVIRFAMDGNSCGMKFSDKFGCKPTADAIKLMEFIKKQGMYLRGFSVHLGSPCYDAEAYYHAIEVCNKFIHTARSMGFNETNLIDIGGGMTGADEDLFEKVTKSVNAALNNLDPSIEVISEPGRYYVESAFTLATYIHSKKVNDDNGILTRHYYINDGIFGSFIDKLYGVKRTPMPLSKINGKKYQSVVWGPTCDSSDCVATEVMIEDLKIGQWMIWKDIGSYSICLASNFNGFPKSAVYPFIRESAMKKFLQEVEILKRKITDDNRF
ncbi:ornithine decarboxylase 2-like [Microplitis mediator]|uniref:ornithine decarboxylase 2-like n=1 Tax=Microplitis mediator TaxID=375433 RepID=UPI002555DF2C|nr:ornithine decarboxylase 2-like [Microplitis mediator]